MGLGPAGCALPLRWLRGRELGAHAVVAALGLTGASAHAQAPDWRPPPLQHPTAAGVAALGGVDVWTDGGGPAAVMRAGLGGQKGDWSGWWGSSAEAIGTASGLLVLDDHRAGVGWAGAGTFTPTARMGVTGAGYAPWLASSAAAGLTARTGRGWQVHGEMGLGARVTFPEAAPEATLALALQRVGALGSVSQVSATVWTGPLPPLALRAEQWLTAGQKVRLELGLATTAVPQSTRAAVPGVPAPGSWVLQGVAAGSVQATERIALRLELTPEVGGGTVRYDRGRAMLGAHATLGRRRDPAPEVVDSSGAVRFELWAPSAIEVSVLGAFTDWQAVPMERSRAGWWSVELDVPPGRWTFGYRVDGEFVAPPSADAWEPDGFGGTNGVIVVSESAATASHP